MGVSQFIAKDELLSVQKLLFRSGEDSQPSVGRTMVLFGRVVFVSEEV